MRIVSFNGSPKGKNSNTNVMIETLIKGMTSNESEIINIYLADKNIQYCRGCYSCWSKTPGKCVINDDMKEMIELMQNTDLFIFGTPLYFNNISGTLKVFFDRLTAAGGNPHKKTSQQNEKVVPHLIMVSNCGFPYRTQFDIISLWIRNVSQLMQLKLIGEFYTTNGKVLTQPTNEQELSRKNYLEYLEECGKQLFDNRMLTDNQKTLQSKNILDF
jgi:multimeric flavodoxin WrbA